jgi:hypothetical protein
MNGQQPTQRGKEKTGDITIEHIPEKKKNSEFIGEYIDFEEIKDKKE